MTSKLQKALAEAVQSFREARNLLPTLHTHLSALENIMTQKATLVGAVRRRAQSLCDPTADAASSSPFLAEDSDDDAQLAGPSCGDTSSSGPSSRRLTHATTAAAVAPLGALSALPVSTLHHIIAQHQRDEEELLGVLSRTIQQSWPQKTEQLRAKVALVETQLAANPASPVAHPAVALAQLSAAQLSMALHGLLACLVKMGSVLQEVMLALRQDTRLSLVCSSPGSAAAAVVADSLSSVLAREKKLCVTSAALLSVRDTGDSGGDDDGGAWRTAERGGAAAAAAEALTLLEAVGCLEGFLEAQWLRCREVYLSEESQMILECV